MPKISILTPYRNAEKYIRQTALSVLGQSYTDWEWILVNDHSEENEVDALGDLLSDKRIRLIENPGTGIIDALCTAFELVNGEYVTRMDADDLMPENKLSLFHAVLEQGNETIVTGKVQYFSDTDAISDGYLNYESWLNCRVDQQDFYAFIYRECSVASANWMMRTADLRACGGFQGLEYPEDYDLLFRWYASDFSITGIDALTHLWRDHEERTSKNSDNYQQEAFFKLKVSRFLSLDRDLSKLLLVNGTGKKGRLTAQVLIGANQEFLWVSHEAHKYKKGIYGQEILSIDHLSLKSKVQILNTTLLSDETLQQIYGSKTGEKSIFLL